MKKIIVFSIPLIFAGILFSCKGNKSHTHGAHSHTHSEEIVSTASQDYFRAYELNDADFGTKTIVTLTENNRVMVTNSLPNHKTGEFPNSGNPNTISQQSRTFKFPLKPKYTGNANWIREPGIALNGIKFEPGTAEVVICDSGENYRVEAFQDIIDLGLDFNNAHVQPTGAYHYHGTPTGVIEKFDSGEDLVHVGFAHDGFPMYYSKSGAYKPSFKLLDGTREGEDCEYSRPGIETVTLPNGGHHDGSFGSDFEYVDGLGDLDECNGITIDGEYVYMVTKEFPYVSRCLMGEFESQERGGPRGGGKSGGSEGRGEQPPNTSQLIELMDKDGDGKISKNEAQGPLQQHFSIVDSNKDGFISTSELEKEIANHKPGRRSN